MVTVAQHYLPGPTSKLPGVQMPALVLRRSVFLWGLSALLLGTLASPAVAQQLSARSGPQTVALLELYTSEGCNSCPPADVLVRSLAAKGLTLDRVVSLGLHVDYWDALGWPDRFAQAIFTQRQREIAARQRTRTVYTPQLVLHGRALSTWGALDAEVQRINHTPARADLSLVATTQTPNTLEVMAQAVVPEAADLPQQTVQVRVSLGVNADPSARNYRPQLAFPYGSCCRSASPAASRPSTACCTRRTTAWTTSTSIVARSAASAPDSPTSTP